MRVQCGALKKLPTISCVFHLCLLVVTCLMIWVNVVGAEVVFEEGWEAATTGWDGPSIPSLMFISTDNPHTNAKSLKMRFPPGEDVAGSIKKFFNTHDELYIRWYQYFSLGWTWYRDATKMIILQPQIVDGPGPNFYIQGGMWGSGTPAITIQYMADQSYDTVNFYQNQGSSFKFQNGRWYCIEVQAKLNTPGQANGGFRMWIDDELKMEYLNRALRGSSRTDPAPSTAQWEYIDIAAYGIGDHSNEEARWLDDLLVSTQRVGCVPHATDTNPPGSPTGLRVNIP